MSLRRRRSLHIWAEKEEEVLVLSDDDNNNDKGTDFCHVTPLQQSTVSGCVQTTVVYSFEPDRSLLITHGTRQLWAFPFNFCGLLHIVLLFFSENKGRLKLFEFSVLR